jgi:hypothetical protein
MQLHAGAYWGCVRAFIPTERPRVVVPHDGSLAAICEPARVTLVALPMGEPFGVIATTGDVAWLGAKLLVTNNEVVRVVDPKAASVVAERTFGSPVHVHAFVGDHALISSGGKLLVVDAQLATREVSLPIPVSAAAVNESFVIAAKDSLIEIDPVTAQRRRTWPIAATTFGGNSHTLWHMTARDRIELVRLVPLGQPRDHVFPEPLSAIIGHPRVDVVAGIGESGRVYLVELTATRRPVALDTGSVTFAESAALILDAGMLVGQEQAPIQFVPFEIPTWRNELVAWTRSGIVDRFPLVPAIEQIVQRLGLVADFIPAITLCYGAYLCGAPGVPAAELSEMLGDRWPDEVRGVGQLAKTGVLEYADGWISLAPTYRAALDDVI